MTFALLIQQGHWTPIRDCPGRYVLRHVSPTLTIQDLLTSTTTIPNSIPIPIHQHHFPHARDTIFVAHLPDGGLISYRQTHSPPQPHPHTWIHTLCTPEGLTRKLQQLQIPLHQPTS